MQPSAKNKIVGYSLIALAIIMLSVVWYKNSSHGGVPIIFSDKNMLGYLWDDYKSEYIEAGTGRAVDKQQNNITTSEGQSYTLLRAVWMDDKPMFDLAYKWTNENLKRKEDHLFAWLFGKKADGSYGVLTEKGGYNTASDADTDIALALVFASERWDNKGYMDAAKSIITDIWNNEVVVLDGVPYMTSNNLEKTQSAQPIINPSYFEPYAYRIFAKIDTKHDWMGLVKSSYDVLEMTAVNPQAASSTAAREASLTIASGGAKNATTAASAGSTSSSSGTAADQAFAPFLPPDWVVISRTTGKVSAPQIQGLTSNFGYDALRVPWKIYLDYQWFGEPRAKAYLGKLTSLSAAWNVNNSLPSISAQNGEVIAANEAPAKYGGSIGYFLMSDKDLAKQVYEQKLIFLVNPDTNNWKAPLGYYDSNWVWFGIAQYNNLLPNLSAYK